MQGKVKVGPATVAGYGATVVGLVATVLVALLGVDQEQAALIASAVWTIVAFAVTQWGRFAQAREVARRPVPMTMLAPAPSRIWDGELDASAGPDKSGTTFRGSTTTAPRPSATMTTQRADAERLMGVDDLEDHDDPDADWTGPDSSPADPALDDPGHVPSREQHSRLKG